MEREQRTHLELDAEVVIVGSGAAGAVTAAYLAEAGQDVVVLEEGGHHPPQQYGSYRPSEHIREMWRDSGMTMTLPVGDSPAIQVMMGRCVGGSSLLTGGVCFRTPGWVLDEWVRDHGLVELSPKAMEPVFEEVAFADEPQQEADAALLLADELETSVEEVPSVEIEPVVHAGRQFADRFEPRFEEPVRQEPAYREPVAETRFDEPVRSQSREPAFLGLQPLEPADDMALDLERELELSIGDGFSDDMMPAEAAFGDQCGMVCGMVLRAEGRVNRSGRRQTK